MGSKRKQEPNSSGPSKKTKMSSPLPKDSGGSVVLSELKILEDDAVKSPTNLNNIVKMMSWLHLSQDTESHIIMVTICSTFCRLLSGRVFHGTPQTLDNNVIVSRWLKTRLDDFLLLLVQKMNGSNSVTGVVALDLYMQIVQAEAMYLHSGNEAKWIKDRLSCIVMPTEGSENELKIHTHLIDNYVLKYPDIHSYTLQLSSDFACEILKSVSLEQRISLLCSLTPSHDDKTKAQSFSRKMSEGSQRDSPYRSLKQAAGKSWLTLLAQPLTIPQRKTLLKLLPRQIAASMERTELLFDFINDSINTGGSMALTALSGLFFLIREKNLDYPGFYSKVYGLLTPATLQSKHRSRFLRLLETFLSSTHVPAVLISSFIKRLSRLCLYAASSTIVAVVPFIYNLLKSHPACTFMIQRSEPSTATGSKHKGTSIDKDPFSMLEHDPLCTRAIDSSLWEIETLRAHYHPNVATICKIISAQFTKQAYSLEDLLDHSYASILDSELSKDMKKLPVVEYQIPHGIFLAGNSGAEHPMAMKWSHSSRQPAV